MKSFSERNLFVEDSLCIPLQNVERSYGLTMIGAFLASRIYPPFPKPGSSHRDGVTTSCFGWVLLRHRTRHSTSPAGFHWQNTITFRSEILHSCDVVCVALPLCAIGSVHLASALVFLSEFPSHRRSADQGWRASSALVFISQGFPSLRLEAITCLLTAWWSRCRTPRGFPLGMTVPPANPPRPGGIIASWSGTAYSTRQAWLILQLTSISEGLSPICHPGTCLVGDGRPTTELEVAYSREM